jgi:hypothetical protein
MTILQEVEATLNRDIIAYTTRHDRESTLVRLQAVGKALHKGVSYHVISAAAVNTYNDWRSN